MSEHAGELGAIARRWFKVMRDLIDKGGHVLNRVDALSRCAAMRLTPEGRDLAPDCAAMPQTDIVNVQRLSDHNIIGVLC